MPWHQDVPINVKERIETEGFHSWTAKKGVISVCPPLAFLQNTVTFRIHLDDTDEENGVLKVIPKSHHTILSRQEIKTLSTKVTPVSCTIKAGGVNLMNPLTLHASEKSKTDKPRRVLHLEFCSLELQNGLEWSEKTLF